MRYIKQLNRSSEIVNEIVQFIEFDLSPKGTQTVLERKLFSM